jgi:hypothetical protein
VRAREVLCHWGGGGGGGGEGAALDGGVRVGFDGCGVRAAGVAGLLGRDALETDFGVAGGFAARRTGGLGGIGEIGVVTGLVQGHAKLLGNTC